MDLAGDGAAFKSWWARPMTLPPSLFVLSATAALGVALIVLYGLQRFALIRWVGPLHGLTGLSGLVLLLLALRGPPRGAAYGVAGFGTIAAMLLGLAIATGLVVLTVRRRRGDPMLAIGLHATLAIFGLVLLAAYASIPG
ncbi:MAG TPA: hypothetical protein VJ779_05440 [Acetobacteraceae bacterium]|nr:hypothetical protein [Acetobacteraceae bacterium]